MLVTSSFTLPAQETFNCDLINVTSRFTPNLVLFMELYPVQLEDGFDLYFPNDT